MIRKELVTLRTVADWKEHAAPRSTRHWKEGRSAQKMARAWVGRESPELPPENSMSPRVTALRYQLLTATAAALAEAARQEAARAVLLIHEFRTERTTDEKIRNNAKDLDRFLQRLSQGTVDAVEEGRLLGPFQVPGHPPLRPAPNLYVGKAVRTARS